MDHPTESAKQFALLMLSTVGITTVAWLTVTYLTSPEPREKLVTFYRTVYPPGPGWRPIAPFAGDDLPQTESLSEQFVNWVLGCTLIYASLFGIGYLLFKEWAWGSGFTLLAIACAIAISRSLSKATQRELALGNEG